ncbi:MAG: nucleoside hydrolase [Limisphaerales bacterium]
MKRNLSRLALFVAFAGTLLAMTGTGQSAEPPVKIIFDTDVDRDCDDIGALFLLHGAVERGEAELLATMACISSDSVAPCLDAMNTWFGRPEIPVGTLKDPGFLASGGYAGEIVRRFPSRFRSGRDYPDAVALYRQVLARQPDASVVVLAVGPLRNLANLLRSGPDAASPLDGPALVAKKVKRLEVMGGNYPPSAKATEAEWNFKQDPAAAALVCSTWPTPILFNGEGGSTCSGRRVTYEMPEHNPLTMAYRHYAGVGFAGDRLSWDPISCLVAVRGAAPWYQVVTGGVNVTDAATGGNTWQAGGDRGHAYLVLQSRKHEIEKALEDMMVSGQGRPANLTFNTAYYAQAGMCQITSRGATEAATSASQAFDHDDQTVWRDQAAASWIQCQFADGRKYLVTSYAVLCPDAHRLPRTLELSGSNDGGASWTRLDAQPAPGFTGQTPRREFTVARPAKWNLYRLDVTAANEPEGVSIATLELNEAIHCRPQVAVAAVTLDRQSLSLPVHGRAALNATLTPRDTWDREVAWVSSDPSVAEVRRLGEQVAMVVGKQPGTCTVTATIDSVKQTYAVTVTPSTLPNGWSYHELNTPPIPGAVSVAAGTFTVTGCGHAMSSWWERVRDQGVLVSQPVSGEVAISARLTRLAPNVGGPNAYQWDSRPPTTAGLMIRESLDQACGRFLLVQVEPSGNLVCRWRDKTGDQDDNQKKELGKVTLPIHLQLVQSGGKLQVFASENGENWGEPRMSHTTAFQTESRIGLFVCSGNTFASTTAAFDSVKVNKP